MPQLPRPYSWFSASERAASAASAAASPAGAEAVLLVHCFGAGRERGICGSLAAGAEAVLLVHRFGAGRRARHLRQPRRWCRGRTSGSAPQSEPRARPLRQRHPRRRDRTPDSAPPSEPRARHAAAASRSAEAVLLVQRLRASPERGLAAASPAAPRPYSWFIASERAPSAASAAASPRCRGRTPGSSLPSEPRARHLRQPRRSAETVLLVHRLRAGPERGLCGSGRRRRDRRRRGTAAVASATVAFAIDAPLPSAPAAATANTAAPARSPWASTSPNALASSSRSNIRHHLVAGGSLEQPL